MGAIGEDSLQRCREIVKQLGPSDIAVFLESSVPSVSPAAATPALDTAAASSAGGRSSSAEGRLPSAEDRLPSAPSHLRAATGKAALRAQLVEDFDKVAAELKKVPGRFVQVVVFRFKGGTCVHALVLQPIDHAAWQSLKLLEDGEMSELDVGNMVVEMGAGSVAKARKGQVVMKDRSVSHSANEKHQRGTDLYTKFFADLEQHAVSYEREEGAARPMLFCNSADGSGDSSTAMMKRCMTEHMAGASGAGTRIAKLVFGLFLDPKDAHYHVATARRDMTIKTEYTEKRFKVEGFEPVPETAELRDLRTEAQRPLGVTMAVLSNVEREGKHYLIMPDEDALHFKLAGAQKEKFNKLKQDFPPPPPPKRLRTAAVGSDLPAGCFSLQTLLSKFTLLKNKEVTVGGLVYRVLQAESKSTGGVYHFLQNHLASRQTIPAKTFFTTTGRGIWVDQKLPEGRGAIREGAIAWPWSLTENTLFCYSFGNDAEEIGPWSAMVAAARRVGGARVKVYAHDFTPTEPPSPIRRGNVDIALVLDEVAPAQWNTATLGSYFSKLDLCDAATSSLRPCLRVVLGQGIVRPVHEQPLVFVSNKTLVMDANSVMLLTICYT